MTQSARKHSQEIETERLLMPRGGGWERGVTAKGEEVFRVMTMSWNETVVRTAQLCKLTKTTGMCSLSRGSVWDGNYTSKKLLK